VLENAIRKVTLTGRWKIGGSEETIKTICFFTDTKAVDTAMKSMPGASAGTSAPAANPSSSTPVSR